MPLKIMECFLLPGGRTAVVCISAARGSDGPGRRRLRWGPQPGLVDMGPGRLPRVKIMRWRRVLGRRRLRIAPLVASLVVFIVHARNLGVSPADIWLPSWWRLRNFAERSIAAGKRPPRVLRLLCGPSSSQVSLAAVPGLVMACLRLPCGLRML